ncbi:MAG: tetratricopeptide repeat protein [Ardenticatenaceae bacterium]|nr:tetratricopeptide repeat protein [Ardenticatenaceae bacterium]
MNAVENQPKDNRRRWLWLIPVILLVLLLGGVIAVRQIEKSHWEAGQTAVAAEDWETAVTEFNAVVYTWPPFLRQHTAEATALRGLAYFQQDKHLAALPDFDAALALDPNQIDILAYRSIIHFEQEAWEQSQSDAEAALAQAELLPDHLLAQLNAQLALLPAELVADDVRETAVAAALNLSNYLPAETVAELYTLQAEYTFASEADATLAAINQALTLEAELTRAQEARLLPEKARLLAQAGRWPDALATIETALDLGDGLSEQEQAALYALRGQLYFKQGDLATAVTAAEKALDLDDSLGWPQAILAWQAYREADYEMAQELAEAALRQDETISLAYTVQGAILTWQGKVHEALDTLALALTHDPTDVEALALQAYNWREIHAVEEMEEAVETAVAANPDAPATIWAQAIAAAENNEWPLTLALMNQAIALDNGRPEFYYYRAPYYPLAADWEKTVADLETSLALNPDFVPAIVGLAYTRGDYYDYTDLEAIQEEVLAAAPDWYGAHLLSGYYYENVAKDNDLALAAYEKAIELLPDRPRVYLARAYYYLSLDEYDKAQADFETVLEMDETASSTYYGLASLAGVNDQVELQEEYLMQAVEISNNSPEARLDLAYYYVIVEEFDKTWQLANQIIAEDETNAGAYLLRAIVHTVEGNNRQALLEIDEALELQPSLVLAYFVKSEALLAEERFFEAARAVETVWQYEPDAYEVHQQLFSIAIQEEEFAEAERQYHLWLSARPEYETGYEVQANMELMLGHFEDAAATFTAGLAEDEGAEKLLFGRALAYLNLEDSDGYRADFEQLVTVGSTIEIISNAEYWLAVDDGLLVAVDGLATYTDEDLGFQISYPAEWERPLLGPEDEYDFVVFLDSAEGYVLVDLLILDGAFGLTLNDIATILNENARQTPGLRVQNTGYSEIGGVATYFQQYRLTVQDGLGNDEVIEGRQYIVLRGSSVWFFTVESSEGLFAPNEATIEAIIASIQFLP